MASSSSTPTLFHTTPHLSHRHHTHVLTIQMGRQAAMASSSSGHGMCSMASWAAAQKLTASAAAQNERMKASPCGGGGSKRGQGKGWPLHNWYTLSSMHIAEHCHIHQQC